LKRISQKQSKTKGKSELQSKTKVKSELLITYGRQAINVKQAGMRFQNPYGVFSQIGLFSARNEITYATYYSLKL